MLKIKDNVNLKELEKFGFEEWDFKRGNYSISVDNKEVNERLFKVPKYCDFVFLTCYKDTRNLTLNFQDMEDYYATDLSVLYDLIKADLVEKVKE